MEKKCDVCTEKASNLYVLESPRRNDVRMCNVCANKTHEACMALKKDIARCFACENPDGEGNTYCLDHYHN